MKRTLKSTLLILTSAFFLVLHPAASFAQSSGGSFTITSHVAAGGGCGPNGGGGCTQSIGSGNLIVEGTAAEPGAADLTREPPFSLRGGFWHTAPGNTPTAANGNISGRVVDNNGTPVEGAAIRMSGTENRLTVTGANGNYHFDNVEINGFYSIVPSRANYTFSPSGRSFSMNGDHTDASFTAVASGDNANPLDTPEYFVRQQYLDFLNREPDQSGFQYWSDQINQCNSDAACIRARRTGVSAAFFIEQEFQLSGSFVYRFYKVSFAARPTFVQFMADRRRVIGSPDLEANRQRFAQDWVQRSEFLQKYPQNLSGPEFIDSLLHTVRDGSGVDLTSQRDELISDYGSHQSRARIVQT